MGRKPSSSRTSFDYFPTRDDAVVGMDAATAADAAERFAARSVEASSLAALQPSTGSRPPPWPTSHRDSGRCGCGVIDEHPVLPARLHAAFASAERALAAAGDTDC